MPNKNLPGNLMTLKCSFFYLSEAAVMASISISANYSLVNMVIMNTISFMLEFQFVCHLQIIALYLLYIITYSTVANSRW